jgi:amidase
VVALATNTQTDLAFASARTQAELVRRGEVTPLELVDLYLERIERLNPELNAFVTVDAEGARTAARDPRPGPFSGVPIAIKDLTETAGLRTTYSSKAFANYVPTRDAAVVRRIRDAGFVILGKTNTPELGSIANTESELNGACRNPWDPSRTPGGSSGGAAAAVAAGLCSIAEASDGGGSIRIPSSCCGLLGIKASRGRISRAPYGNGVMGIATNGPIARTVADAAALLDVLAGYEPGDAYTAPPPSRPFADEVGADPGRLRIAVTTQPPFDVPVHPACTGAASTFADLLTELGHEVEETASPFADAEAPRFFGRVWALGPAVFPAPDESLEPLNQMLAARARRTTSAELAEAIVALDAFTRRVLAFWGDYDVVVTPTLAQPPVPVGWAFAPADPAEQFRQQFSFTPFTAVVNITGQPAVAIPATEHEGLPIGVQAIGRANDEVSLIRLAAQVEQARPWAGKRPPLS